ncbi:hypothetical protein [Pandoraea sp. CB10b_02]|uniref:hypothetical protein n=1 Tax=Pandoraea sp. CB10b_02 TaxID=2014535 RepID=UPI00257EB229|nr:hypothetical protein [Pandoraea sp. CB10b_02]
MNKINDGGPAFGQVVELRCVRVEMDGSTEWEPEAMVHGGLTVRDYFAAKAMQGLAANPEAWDMTDEKVAEWAYNAADAMLKAREGER